MKNSTVIGIQVVIVAALAGIALRQFEQENFTLFGSAVLGIMAIGVGNVIRVRNYFDRKALNSKD
jgi:cyanate permease